MHLLLSYCKSHIYELHALLAATITLVAMHFVKKPVTGSRRKKGTGRDTAGGAICWF